MLTIAWVRIKGTEDECIAGNRIVYENKKDRIEKRSLYLNETQY